MSAELVTIVTAFVDIGRGDWEGTKNDKPIPHYIKRDTETYLKRFERLTELKNPIVCFTQSKFIERILCMRKDIKVINIDDIFEQGSILMDSIKKVQQDPHFINFVSNPSNPEYWSPEYVAINLFKSVFLTQAIDNDLVETDTCAWIDFGYCRPETHCPPGMEWKFDTGGLINLFCMNPNVDEKPIFEIVKTNDVYMQGCHIVAPKKLWITLRDLININLSNLFNVGLVDDDQTLLLMAYRSQPDLFKLNKADPNDWFTIFRDFNHG
jgi:protein YibB